MQTIETNKGKFVVTDNLEEINRWINNGRFLGINCLNSLTEKQASEIVYSWTQNYTGWIMYMNYHTKFIDHSLSAIQSLHSLLESKGIEINKNTHIFLKV